VEQRRVEERRCHRPDLLEAKLRGGERRACANEPRLDRRLSGKPVNAGGVLRTRCSPATDHGSLPSARSLAPPPHRAEDRAPTATGRRTTRSDFEAAHHLPLPCACAFYLDFEPSG